MMRLQEPTLAQRFQQIQGRIRECAGSGPNPAILAVSKGQSPDSIRELFALGQRRFAENYVQELLEKVEALRDLPIEWVFIGQLQSNKIRKIVLSAEEIQTICSLRHASLTAAAAAAAGKPNYPIFIQVNAGSEESKGGVAPSEVLALAAAIRETLPILSLQGIMAIPPVLYSDASYSKPPALYRDLRLLASQVGQGRLSLGMSDDLRIAIESGSDIVRIGRALMGSRSRK